MQPPADLPQGERVRIRTASGRRNHDSVPWHRQRLHVLGQLAAHRGRRRLGAHRPWQRQGRTRSQAVPKEPRGATYQTLEPPPPVAVTAHAASGPPRYPLTDHGLRRIGFRLRRRSSPVKVGRRRTNIRTCRWSSGLLGSSSAAAGPGRPIRGVASRRRRTIARSRASGRPALATVELAGVPDAVDEDLDGLGGTNVDDGHVFMILPVTCRRSETRDFADERPTGDATAHHPMVTQCPFFSPYQSGATSPTLLAGH